MTVLQIRGVYDLSQQRPPQPTVDAYQEGGGEDKSATVRRLRIRRSKEQNQDDRSQKKEDKEEARLTFPP